MALGHVYNVADGMPVNYTDYAWSGFAVVISTNLVGLVVILVRRDIVWCVAATWIAISIWSKRPKPAPVYVRTPPSCQESSLVLTEWAFVDHGDTVHGSPPSCAVHVVRVSQVLLE